MRLMPAWPRVLAHRLADREVLVQQLAVLLAVGEPAAVPGAVDLQAQADRIDLLAHQAFSSTCRTLMVSWLNGFSIRPNRPARPGAPALHHQVLADIGLDDDEVVDVEAVVVLRVRHRRLERLLDVLADALLREGEVGERLLHLHVADHRGDEVELARARPDHPVDGHRLVLGDAARVLLLAHPYLRFAFLSAAWP
jgi:hypothetical protein